MIRAGAENYSLKSILLVMQIIEALKVLADTKENQIDYLENLGTFPSTDELALQFDDSYHVFRWKFEEMNIDSLYKENIFNNIDEINLTFDKMSKISENSFWDVSSLNGVEWDYVRRLAGETLQLILNLEV